MMTRIPARAMRARAFLALVAAVCAGCEPAGAHLTAPRGADAFARFTVIGGAMAMGAQSGGVVAETQATSWPAIIAARTGVTFHQPLFRTPGCSPPLVAPLLLGRWLSGASTALRDSSCNGLATTDTDSKDNLAMIGATAWSALTTTPRAIAGAPTSYDFVDRTRLALVLGSTQSQVTAMLVKAPTFVAVELGFAELARAAASGLVIPAASYTQSAAWTLVPAAVFTPVFDQIADSAAKSGARVVVVSVPRVTTLPAFRSAAEVWAERAPLSTYGVAVQPDCQTSANTINVAAKIPPLVLAATAAGTAQPLSCADTPNAADFVLTPADVAALDGAATAMNAHFKSVAAAHGWAYADLTDALGAMVGQVGAFSSRDLEGCALPFGYNFSLDGVLPSADGQQWIADVVAAAINAQYGYSLPVAGVSTALRVKACP